MGSDLENSNAQVGNVPKLKSIDTIVLYDPENGKIHHMHRVLNLEGCSPLDPQEVEKNLILTAGKLGHNIEKLKILHTESLQDISGSYRVDIEKKTLIRLSEPLDTDTKKY